MLLKWKGTVKREYRKVDADKVVHASSYIPMTFEEPILSTVLTELNDFYRRSSGLNVVLSWLEF